MTMAGLEVEHVADAAAALAAFSVAKIVDAVQHPNADRLRVCQVDTRDGRKEIVCGASNARPGLTTIRSEEHTSELQSRQYLVCRLLLEKKKKQPTISHIQL